MNPAIATIQRVVAAEFRVTTGQLCSRDRHEPLATARRVAMALCRELTGERLQRIGAAFRRDHCTVIHAIGTVSGQRDTEQAFAVRLENIALRCRALIGEDYIGFSDPIILLDAVVNGPDEQIGEAVGRARRYLALLHGKVVSRKAS